MIDTLERFHGCLLGLAVGDAVGTTIEFRPRGSFPLVTDMLGGGPFSLRPGEWTDDTSMALCLATSLVECHGFDPRDQMERYQRWWQEGYLSSTGKCFDIGGTTARALSRFQASGDPFSGLTDPASAGNGSLMRLAPIALFYYPQTKEAHYYAAESSRTTHAALECLDACQLFAGHLIRALDGFEKEEVLFGSQAEDLTSSSIQAIARGNFRFKTSDDIHTSGYVVHTLEAALWCFYSTGSFEEAILKAVNLGDDADTTAAVCGQLAGAYYGEPAIPRRWLDKLVLRDHITTLADALNKYGARSN